MASVVSRSIAPDGREQDVWLRQMALFFAATQLPIYLLPLLIEQFIRIRSLRPRTETKHADTAK